MTRKKEQHKPCLPASCDRQKTKDQKRWDRELILIHLFRVLSHKNSYYGLSLIKFWNIYCKPFHLQSSPFITTVHNWHTKFIRRHNFKMSPHPFPHIIIKIKQLNKYQWQFDENHLKTFYISINILAVFGVGSDNLKDECIE